MNLTSKKYRKKHYRRIRASTAMTLLVWFLTGTNTATAGSDKQSLHDSDFRHYAEKFFGQGFDWRLFKSQGFVESRLRQQAKSHRGAKGVMQIMPATYREIQKKNKYFGDKHFDETSINIAAGIFYDYYLYSRWEKNRVSADMRLKLMLASYNAGYSRTLKAWNKADKPVYDWEAVNKRLPKETQQYIDRIITHYEKQTSTVLTQRGDGCPISTTFERSFC